MKHHLSSLLFVLCVLCIAKQSGCYKILAIVATPSYSHQIPYRRLWLELHKRGHEVVLATANPIPNIKSPNFTQIDISKSYGKIKSLDFVQMRFEGKRWLYFIQEEMLPMGEVFAETVFNSTELRNLYAPDSNATFDVFLTEVLFLPSIYAFAHRFDVPIIGMSLIFIYIYICIGFPTFIPFWKSRIYSVKHVALFDIEYSEESTCVKWTSNDLCMSFIHAPKKTNYVWSRSKNHPSSTWNIFHWNSTGFSYIVVVLIKESCINSITERYFMQPTISIGFGIYSHTHTHARTHAHTRSSMRDSGTNNITYWRSTSKLSLNLKHMFASISDDIKRRPWNSAMPKRHQTNTQIFETITHFAEVSKFTIKGMAIRTLLSI